MVFGVGCKLKPARPRCRGELPFGPGEGVALGVLLNEAGKKRDTSDGLSVACLRLNDTPSAKPLLLCSGSSANSSSL